MALGVRASDNSLKYRARRLEEGAVTAAKSCHGGATGISTMPVDFTASAKGQGQAAIGRVSFALKPDGMELAPTVTWFWPDARLNVTTY